VKVLKEAINQLGANKTEELIDRVSKPGQVVDGIVEQIDVEFGLKHVKTTHKSRSEKNDLKEILTRLWSCDHFPETKAFGQRTFFVKNYLNLKGTHKWQRKSARINVNFNYFIIIILMQKSAVVYHSDIMCTSSTTTAQSWLLKDLVLQTSIIRFVRRDSGWQ